MQTAHKIYENCSAHAKTEKNVAYRGEFAKEMNDARRPIISPGSFLLSNLSNIFAYDWHFSFSRPRCRTNNRTPSSRWTRWRKSFVLPLLGKRAFQSRSGPVRGPSKPLGSANSKSQRERWSSFLELQPKNDWVSLGTFLQPRFLPFAAYLLRDLQFLPPKIACRPERVHDSFGKTEGNYSLPKFLT